MHEPLYDQIEQAAQYLRQRMPDFVPAAGMILGSGFGEVINSFSILEEIPYAKIPHFPLSTVIGHRGSLIFAEYKGKRILVLSGRFHYYEGYSMQRITFPLRVMGALGISMLILTAAAGGLNPAFEEGEITVLKDHINLLPDSPLRGPNDERLGIRFPDMSRAYSPVLRKRLSDGALANSLPVLRESVYAAFPGPSLETPAEYKFLHTIGADLVGMSVVPEVIVARHMQMELIGFGIVSNICYPPERIQETTAEQVIEVVAHSAGRLLPYLEMLLDI